MASATLTQPRPDSDFDAVIGVDTHRDFHVAVAVSPNGARLDEYRISTNPRGYQALLGWSELFGNKPVFAMEGTNSFGAGLCRELMAAGFVVVEANRPDRSTRRRLGKDDGIDAEMAARAFLAGTAMAVPKSGEDQVEMIRMLKVAKDSAIDARTKAINQMRALLVTATPALRERLNGLSRGELISTCAAFRAGALVGPLAAAKQALRTLARRVQVLDAELDELLKDLDVLTQEACPGMRQTYGIGVDGAAILLTAAGDNPERLRSEASFAALCGASPLPASSGNTRRHRLNRGGNRQAIAALHRIAVGRLRYHQATKAYAERRRGEGLSNKEILRCLKRFIAREVFHLLMGRDPMRTAAT